MVRKFLSRPDGTSYDGPFMHPLTPYKTSKGVVYSMKGDKSGLPYRDWPLFTIGSESQIPPKVCSSFYQQERWRLTGATKIVARGYAMSNMKPLIFLEAESPLFHVLKEQLPVLQADVAGLIAASDNVRRSLITQIVSAWKKDSDQNTHKEKVHIDAFYWSETESAFYEALYTLTKPSELENPEARRQCKLDFLAAIAKKALGIYDLMCPINVDSMSCDIGRVIKSRSKFTWMISPTGTFLMQSIGLAPKDPERGKNKKSKKSGGQQ